MDYQELLFAAEVLKIAKQLNDKARKEYQSTLTHMDGATQNKTMDRWEKNHPAKEFFKEALEEIIFTAANIKQLADTA